MVNMPAYEITLASLILKFLLQSKDSLFLSTIIQCTRIRVCVCTYVCVGVCTRACDCTCMQMDSPNPKEMWIDSLLLPVCVYIYIYIYIYI